MKKKKKERQNERQKEREREKEEEQERKKNKIEGKQEECMLLNVVRFWRGCRRGLDSQKELKRSCIW